MVFVKTQVGKELHIYGRGVFLGRFPNPDGSGGTVGKGRTDAGVEITSAECYWMSEAELEEKLKTLKLVELNIEQDRFARDRTKQFGVELAEKAKRDPDTLKAESVFLLSDIQSGTTTLIAVYGLKRVLTAAEKAELDAYIMDSNKEKAS